MTNVTFYPMGACPEWQLRFAVIVARMEGKWIFCRHRERDTWEIPGGHIEEGETPNQAAQRELWEETGAVNADISKIGVYGVEKDGKETFGVLYFAEVSRLGMLPIESEIEKVKQFDSMPEHQTYPEIQPMLFQWALEWLADH